MGSWTLTPAGRAAICATRLSSAVTVSITPRTPLAFSPPNFSSRSTTRIVVPATSESTGTGELRNVSMGRICARYGSALSMDGLRKLVRKLPTSSRTLPNPISGRRSISLTSGEAGSIPLSPPGARLSAFSTPSSSCTRLIRLMSGSSLEPDPEVTPGFDWRSAAVCFAFSILDRAARVLQSTLRSA